jgi:hypothetical protein
VLSKSQVTSYIIHCIVFNMIFLMTTSSLYPHTYNDLSLSRAVNYKHRFNHKDQEGFSMPRKEGHLMVDGYFFFQADIEYPFEPGKVINYTLHGV